MITLHFTANSPYARICRIYLRQIGLHTQIHEVLAQTRDPDSALFDQSPLGRVPLLVDQAVTLSDTRDICAYLDQLAGITTPRESNAQIWQRHVGFGFLDGVAVWLRENARPEGAKSADVMRYEQMRAGRVLAWLNAHWQPGFRLTDLAIATSLDIALDRGMDRGILPGWDGQAPRIMAWLTNLRETEAFAETRFEPMG